VPASVRFESNCWSDAFTSEVFFCQMIVQGNAAFQFRQAVCMPLPKWSDK
jgi:hypothetical protein